MSEIKGIRMLALDIDDTLVGADSIVSERNKRAIEAAIKAGARVVFATGRCRLGACMLIDQLPITEPVICFGGALLYAPDLCTLLEARYLEEADVRKALALAKELHLHAQVYLGDEVVFRRLNAFARIYTGRQSLPYRVEKDMEKLTLTQVPKVLVYAPGRLEARALRRMREALPENVSILMSKRGFLEIGRTDCTKGLAVRRLAEKWGIAREQVAAIGDNTLDMDMIEWAGVGCCVENGNESVKEKADLILPACEDDGVACFIEEYLLHQTPKSGV